MKTNSHKAKTQLSRLIEKAFTGVVRLLAVAPQSTRELGSAAGLITWQERWEQPLTSSEMAEFLS